MAVCQFQTFSRLDFHNFSLTINNYIFQSANSVHLRKQTSPAPFSNYILMYMSPKIYFAVVPKMTWRWKRWNSSPQDSSSKNIDDDDNNLHVTTLDDDNNDNDTSNVEDETPGRRRAVVRLWTNLVTTTMTIEKIMIPMMIWRRWNCRGQDGSGENVVGDNDKRWFEDEK